MPERGSVRLPAADYELIRRESLKIQLELDMRITIGQLIMAAFRVALKHRSEFIKELTNE